MTTDRPGALSLLEDTGGGFAEIETLPAPALIGQTVTNLPAGPLSRLDKAARLQVTVLSGELSSVSYNQLLSVANLAAVAARRRDGKSFNFKMLF